VLAVPVSIWVFMGLRLPWRVLWSGTRRFRAPCQNWNYRPELVAHDEEDQCSRIIVDSPARQRNSLCRARQRGHLGNATSQAAHLIVPGLAGKEPSESTFIVFTKPKGRQHHRKSKVSIKRAKPTVISPPDPIVWCWDISYMPTGIRGLYCCAIIDVYNVNWCSSR